MLHPILVSDINITCDVHEWLSDVVDRHLPPQLHQQITRFLDLVIGDRTYEQVSRVIWLALGPEFPFLPPAE